VDGVWYVSNEMSNEVLCMIIHVHVGVWCMVYGVWLTSLQCI